MSAASLELPAFRSAHLCIHRRSSQFLKAEHSNPSRYRLIVCTIGILMGAYWPELGGCGFKLCEPDKKPYYIVGDIPEGFPPFSIEAAFNVIGSEI